MPQTENKRRRERQAGEQAKDKAKQTNYRESQSSTEEGKERKWGKRKEGNPLSPTRHNVLDGGRGGRASTLPTKAMATPCPQPRTGPYICAEGKVHISILSEERMLKKENLKFWQTMVLNGM